MQEKTPKTDDERRRDAHAKARELLKADASQATADYRNAQRETLERTRKLREQRLAREESGADGR